MIKECIICPDHSLLVSVLGEISAYRLLKNGAESFANSINRELAESPTRLYKDNYYGPVELWPLVLIEEGD